MNQQLYPNPAVGQPRGYPYDSPFQSTSINYNVPPTIEALATTARLGIRALLTLMGEDPYREGLAATPDRVVKAYLELADQPGDVASLLAVTFTEDFDEMVAVGPIDFVSLCEHHLLPFTGTAWVAYIPTPTIGVVGLSKIPRLVDHYAHRPQIQERLTRQIADALYPDITDVGAACVIHSTHSCMSLRGVKKTAANMVTSAMLGAFREDPSCRAEFLALTHHRT